MTIMISRKSVTINLQYHLGDLLFTRKLVYLCVQSDMPYARATADAVYSPYAVLCIASAQSCALDLVISTVAANQRRTI
jgi:hypothetical protein